MNRYRRETRRGEIMFTVTRTQDDKGTVYVVSADAASDRTWSFVSRDLYTAAVWRDALNAVGAVACSAR
jgi:hypothetical protein